MVLPNGVNEHGGVSSPVFTRHSSFKGEVAYPHPTLLRSLADAAADDSPEMFASALKKLSAQSDELLKTCEKEVSSSSPVQAACLLALRTRMPYFLKQGSLLIQDMNDNIQNQKDNSALFVQKLRSRFALVTAAQCLDTIQAAMTCPERKQLDEQLTKILSQSKEREQALMSNSLSLRVSHWVAPSLAFDLPAGKSVSRVLDGTERKDSLPLEVEVEPVVTFPADALLHGNTEKRTLRFCRVEIESCKHTPREFSEGAGTIGVAVVRVRVSPLDQAGKRALVWGQDVEGDRIYVKAARAVQLNAYPPKPRANVDLFTHSVYGDAGISLTLVIKTCATDCGDPPKLYVELFMGEVMTFF